MDYPQENIKPYGNEGTKVKQVERMFDHIAPTYDQLNHTLSLGIDRSWRRESHPYTSPLPSTTDDGRGYRYRRFCHFSLPRVAASIAYRDWYFRRHDECSTRKSKAGPGLADRISFVREDCTALSFAESSFDAVTVAFGIRNFEHLDLGLHEMCRVLRPGGHLVILELSTPDRFPMKQLFFLYSKIIMPLIGKLISKDNSAYTY